MCNSPTRRLGDENWGWYNAIREGGRVLGREIRISKEGGMAIKKRSTHSGSQKIGILCC